jgi:hypothetical protein
MKPLRWGARATDLLALSAGALLAVGPAVLKLVKGFTVTEGRPPVLDVPVLIAPDLVWGAALGAVIWSWVRLVGRSRAGSVLAWAFTTLTLLVLFGLTALEHQTWVKTASLLDWGILSYTLRHYSELQIVIASESTVGGAVLLSAAGVLAIVPLLLDGLLGHRVLVRWPMTQRARTGWLVLALAAVGASFAQPSAPELVPIARSAAVSLLADARDVQGVA